MSECANCSVNLPWLVLCGLLGLLYYMRSNRFPKSVAREAKKHIGDASCSTPAYVVVGPDDSVAEFKPSMGEQYLALAIGTARKRGCYRVLMLPGEYDFDNTLLNGGPVEFLGTHRRHVVLRNVRIEIGDEDLIENSPLHSWIFTSLTLLGREDCCLFADFGLSTDKGISIAGCCILVLGTSGGLIIGSEVYVPGQLANIIKHNVVCLDSVEFDLGKEQQTEPIIEIVGRHSLAMVNVKVDAKNTTNFIRIHGSGYPPALDVRKCDLAHCRIEASNVRHLALIDNTLSGNTMDDIGSVSVTFASPNDFFQVEPETKMTCDIRSNRMVTESLRTNLNALSFPPPIEVDGPDISSSLYIFREE